jgi:hypothetical protein
LKFDTYLFLEFESLQEAKEVIGDWIKNNYNQFYVYSALGYRGAEEFEAEYHRRTIAKVSCLTSILFFRPKVSEAVMLRPAGDIQVEVEESLRRQKRRWSELKEL